MPNRVPIARRLAREQLRVLLTRRDELDRAIVSLEAYLRSFPQRMAPQVCRAPR